MYKTLNNKKMTETTQDTQVVELPKEELKEVKGGGIIETIKSWLGIDSGFQFGGGSFGGGGASGSW